MSEPSLSGVNASHLEAMASTTTDALIAIDHEGSVISWNRAAAEIFGYTAEEMMGQSLAAIIPEQYRKAHDRGLARVDAGGRPHVIGKAVRLAGKRKDGSEFPLELTLSTWKARGKNFYGGIIRDVTERARMEEALRLSELRNRSIMETANDAIIVADRTGHILAWNEAARNIFGFEASEVLDHSLTLIIPDEFKAAHERGMERVTRGH